MVSRVFHAWGKEIPWVYFIFITSFSLFRASQDWVHRVVTTAVHTFQASTCRFCIVRTPLHTVCILGSLCTLFHDAQISDIGVGWVYIGIHYCIADIESVWEFRNTPPWSFVLIPAPDRVHGALHVEWGCHISKSQELYLQFCHILTAFSIYSWDDLLRFAYHSFWIEQRSCQSVVHDWQKTNFSHDYDDWVSYAWCTALFFGNISLTF